MSDALAAEAWAVYQAAECLFDRAAVEAAVQRLAGEVAALLGDRNPLLLCPMSGGVALAGGELAWKVIPSATLAGRHVLIIDDVLDRGITLAALVEFCRRQRAAAVHTLVLVDKQCQREAAIEADFVGLTAPDRYLFGWGMDYKGYLRNAPGIYAVAGT